MTPYNNPAFQIFLMATLKPYNLKWKTGEKEMLLVEEAFKEVNHKWEPSDSRDWEFGHVKTALRFMQRDDQEERQTIIGWRMVSAIFHINCIKKEEIDIELENRNLKLLLYSFGVSEINEWSSGTFNNDHFASDLFRKANNWAPLFKATLWIAWLVAMSWMIFSRKY